MFLSQGRRGRFGEPGLQGSPGLQVGNLFMFILVHCSSACIRATDKEDSLMSLCFK